MSLPYSLANVISMVRVPDTTKLVVGRSFYFSDADPSFSVDPTSTSIVAFDGDAVAGQIELVLGTPLGTEAHEPTFGSKVMNFLFDNQVQSNYDMLQLEALTALKTWLGGRLDFYSVTIIPEPTSGDMIISIPFKIKTSGVALQYLGNLTAMSNQLAS